MEFLREENQAFKDQYMDHLDDPCFRVVTRELCFVFPDSFQGLTEAYVWAVRQHRKPINDNSSVAYMKEISEKTPRTPQEPLSPYYQKYQNEIDAQITEIANMKEELS